MRSALAAAAATLAIASGSSAIEVKLLVEENAGVARKGDVVTTGVPFAKGALQDVSRLRVTSGGRAIPAQFIRTVPWPDGSVRWALMDCRTDVAAGGVAELVVSDRGASPAPRIPVAVDVGADAVKVSTGALDFTISRTKPGLFASMKVDGKELVTSASRGLVLYKAGGGEVPAGPPEKVTVEQAGPMRAIVCLRGKYPGVHNGLLTYTVRVTAYAGKRFVKMAAWLENGGKFGYIGGGEWFNFDGLALELGLGLGGEITASCEGASAKGKLKVSQRCTPGYDWKSFNYSVTGPGGDEIKKGARTDGVVALSGAAGRLTAAVRHFWQNYEKAIELDGTTLKLWLWPTDGEWPRPVRRGRRNTNEFRQFCKRGLYALQGGLHKRYEMILDLSGRDAKASAATLNSPLMARATPEYYAGTEAGPGWFAPAGTSDGGADYAQKVKNWNRQAKNAVDPKERTSLIRTRRGGAEGRGFWYGWMDFGDLLWANGYCTLHYDWSWVMLLNYLRQGDRGFLDMGEEMIRHRVDVDQVWSDRVAHYFRGLGRWETSPVNLHGDVNGGRSKPITSHFWGSGVVLHYMLTGDPKSKECALRGGVGIRLRQVNKYKDKPSAGGQSRSSGWAILFLCSLYDMTADRKYLDDAMVLFSNHLMEQRKASGPFLVKSNHLQYYYGTQGFCELAERTGDAKVLEFIKAGVEADFEKTCGAKTYNEWPMFLSNIYAYLGHKTDNEGLVKKAEDYFCRVVSKSPSPPCHKSSGAWTKETCKTLRNGHILQFVKWKRAGGGLKEIERTSGGAGGAGAAPARRQAPAQRSRAADGASRTDPKAAELYRAARRAERAGMKDLARTLYERLIEEHPDSPLAEKARKRP